MVFRKQGEQVIGTHTHTLPSQTFSFCVNHLLWCSAACLEEAFITFRLCRSILCVHVYVYTYNIVYIYICIYTIAFATIYSAASNPLYLIYYSFHHPMPYYFCRVASRTSVSQRPTPSFLMYMLAQPFHEHLLDSLVQSWLRETTRPTGTANEH